MLKLIKRRDTDTNTWNWDWISFLQLSRLGNHQFSSFTHFLANNLQCTQQKYKVMKWN